MSIYLGMAYRGKFRPTNPSKYDGNPSKIIYRSLWELRLMKYCDTSKNILKWSSEEVIIPYRSPLDGKVHRYFPDFLMHVRQADNSVKVLLVEVKPHAQTMPPQKLTEEKKTLKRKRRYNKAVKTYAVNKAKWDAAEIYCQRKGWEFTILTEKTLAV